MGDYIKVLHDGKEIFAEFREDLTSEITLDIPDDVVGEIQEYLCEHCTICADCTQLQEEYNNGYADGLEAGKDD